MKAAALGAGGLQHVPFVHVCPPPHAGEQPPGGSGVMVGVLSGVVGVDDVVGEHSPSGQTTPQDADSASQ